MSRNELIAEIVTKLGGTVTDPNNRNQLLRDWLGALGGSGGGLTYLDIESVASNRLFGSTSHTFNVTAPAGTDGGLFVVLVQKKNQGVFTTDIEIDDGPIVDAKSAASSNPGGIENQLAVFEDKTFLEGSHSISIRNIDGMEGASIVAVYYKNYTGLTGNFSASSSTGAQSQQLIIGDNNWAVTPSNRGVNILFAGGLNNLVSEVASPEYPESNLEFPTTDTNNNVYNGKLLTCVDFSFADNSSNTAWAVDWDSAGVEAEVVMITGELEVN